MLPFVPERLPDLSGKHVFLSAGELDQIVPRTQVEKLKEIFENSGAKVILSFERSDHSLIQKEIEKVRKYVQEHFV